MAFLGRRDGRNFALLQTTELCRTASLKRLLVGNITPPSRRTVIAGGLSSAGVKYRIVGLYLITAELTKSVSRTALEKLVQRITIGLRLLTSEKL